MCCQRWWLRQVSPALGGHSCQPRGLEGATSCAVVSGHRGEVLTGSLAKIRHAKMMWHICAELCTVKDMYLFAFSHLPKLIYVLIPTVLSQFPTYTIKPPSHLPSLQIMTLFGKHHVYCSGFPHGLAGANTLSSCFSLVPGCWRSGCTRVYSRCWTLCPAPWERSVAVTFPEAGVHGAGRGGQLQTGAVLAAPKRKSLSCKAPLSSEHTKACALKTTRLQQ